MCLLIFLFLGAASSSFADHEQPEFGKPLWNTTFTDQLKRDLLATYDKFARPAQHTNVTKVNLGLAIKHVHLDDTKSLMTVNAWVRLYWQDEKLQWNASDYGGLKVLHLADHEIWQPDIVLYNSALGNNIDHFGNTHCLATSDGSVLWVPPSQFVVFCDFDLSKWPFDRQVCKLELGSWTYSGEQVDLQLNEKQLEFEEEMTEWKLVEVSQKRLVTYYTCCVEPYIHVEYSLTLDRRSPSYRAVVILPAMCTLLLTLSALWLPVQGRERYLLCGLTAVLVSMFLLYFCLRLPLIGPCTPLIVLFHSCSLLMTCWTIILSIICHNLSRSQVRLPRHLVALLRGRMSSIMLLPTPRLKAEYEEEACTGEELRDYEGSQDDRQFLSRRGPDEGWVLFTAALDRIFFLCYLFIFGGFLLRALL